MSTSDDLAPSFLSCYHSSEKTVKMIHGLLKSHEDAAIKRHYQHVEAERLIIHFVMLNGSLANTNKSQSAPPLSPLMCSFSLYTVRASLLCPLALTKRKQVQGCKTGPWCLYLNTNSLCPSHSTSFLPAGCLLFYSCKSVLICFSLSSPEACFDPVQPFLPQSVPSSLPSLAQGLISVSRWMSEPYLF